MLAPLLISLALAYPPSPVPGFVAPVEADLDSLPPPGQGSAGVYWLLTDLQDQVATEMAYAHHAVRILTEAGLSEASEIAVEFAPDYEELRWHRITLWRDGRARELLPSLKPTEMRREEGYEWGLLDGRKTQLFNLEDVRVGDVIEYAYTTVGSNPILAGRSSEWRYFRFGAPVERLHYRILHPPERPLRLTYFRDAPKPREGRSGGEVELTWDVRKTGTHVFDDDAPSWFDPDPRVQWSEYRTWGEVAAWARDLYAVKGPLSPALEAEAARLRKLEPAERIRRALRLVQDEVRYLGLEMGVSSHRPSHPSKVFARRFGDCKDKSLLFCALLGRAGMEAVPVLVNTRAQATVASFQPSPQAFDHVIARVEHEGRHHFLDPTLSHQRGDPLASGALEYGRGLPIAAGVTGFDTIAPAPDAGRTDMLQVFVLPRLDTAAILEVTTTYAGSEADRIRAYFAKDSREEIQRAYINYYAATYPAISVASPMHYEDDTSANVVTVRESYAVDSLCKAEPGGKAGCVIYPQEIAHWVSEPDRRIRTSPYLLAYPKQVFHTVKAVLPEPPGFTAEGGEVAREDFRFRWSEEMKEDTAVLRYEYRALADHVPLERFPAYLAALDTVEMILGATLYTGTHSSPGPGAGLNHFLVLVVLLSAAGGVWAARRLLRLAPGPAPADLRRPADFNWALWYLAAVLLARPILQAWSLWRLAFLFDLDAWTDFTAPGGDAYHPLWLPALLLGISGGLVLWICDLAILPSFFQRRRSFPRALKISLAGNLALFLGLIILFMAIPDGVETEFALEFISSWMTCLFWGGFFLIYRAFSRRGKHAFVLPLPEPAAGMHADHAPSGIPAPKEKVPEGG